MTWLFVLSLTCVTFFNRYLFLEQHKFKSNEKDRALKLFYPFFGILWAYLLN